MVRMRNNVSEPLDRACAGRVLPARNMRSHLIMIDGIFRMDSAKVLRVHRTDPIKRSAYPFCQASGTRWAGPGCPLLAPERGILVSYEIVRRWVNRFDGREPLELGTDAITHCLLPHKRLQRHASRRAQAPAPRDHLGRSWTSTSKRGAFECTSSSSQGRSASAMFSARHRCTRLRHTSSTNGSSRAMPSSGLPTTSREFVA